MASDSQEALRRRAREGLVDAPERAGARAHFRAMGIDPARLGGPIVGVASSWTGTMPCNLNHRELAERVAEGVTAAGGVALPFSTIAVSDNQSQGTPGMRASLVSREVIADSIELMAHAHDFDALVCVVGCDKTVPAALMALARLDRPAVVLSSGPMRAGRLDGRALTIQDVWEAVGAEERGLITREELDAVERAACPAGGTCAGHFTANTMAVALECLGIAALGDGLVPAGDADEKAAAATRAGELAVRLARDGVTARRFLDRRALRNAMAGIAATGGSTNGVLHLLAIAREAGVALDLDELAEVSRATPVLASLVPSGRFVAEDFHRAGGTRCAPTGARPRRPRGRRGADGRPARRSRPRREDAPRARRRGAAPARAPGSRPGRAPRPAREPRARREPREARGVGAARAARARARVRERGGVQRRRPRGSGPRGRRARRAL